MVKRIDKIISDTIRHPFTGLGNSDLYIIRTVIKR